jgi:hypothetical protein
MKSSGVVFHTSVPPHVRETVRAFAAQDQLAAFLTTLYAGKFPLGAWTQCLPAAWTARIMQRRIQDIPLDRVQCMRRWEILRLAIPGPGSLRESMADAIWEYSEHSFSRWVAGHIPEDAGFVYGYDHMALETFLAAGSRGIHRVLEICSPEWDAMQSLTRTEMERMGLGNDPYLALCEQHHARRTRRCREEWNLADRIIVNSEVTRQSFTRAGYAMDRVRMLPLGAPTPRIEALADWTPPAEHMARLLWVGPFTPRKGVRILKQAMASSQWPRGATLDVYGSVPVPEVARGFPLTIHWHGPRPQAEVWAAMSRADALILPTLADGFGMALTEAWAHGLPVLTTDQAGAAAWMTHEEHGLIFPAGNSDALVQAVAAFIGHAPAWPQWRRACLALAKRLSWEQYRERLPSVALSVAPA